MTLEVRGADTPAGAASATHDDPRAPMLAGDGRVKAILVADDDAGTRALLRDALATVDGWVATAVADGAAVLRLLESVQPDLIVLDVTLPGLDGVAAYQLLRAGAPHRSVPVLFLSGEARPRAAHPGARGGGPLSLARQTLSAGRSARRGRRPAGGRGPGTTVGDGGCSARLKRAACCEREREPP
jgi:CheY-like chemotaxis protein